MRKAQHRSGKPFQTNSITKDSLIITPFDLKKIAIFGADVYGRRSMISCYENNVKFLRHFGWRVRHIFLYVYFTLHTLLALLDREDGSQIFEMQSHCRLLMI